MRKQSWVFVALSLSLVAGILASEVLSYHYGHADQEARQEASAEIGTSGVASYRVGNPGSGR